MKDRINQILTGKGIFQFIKFGMVGIGNTLVSLVVTYMLMYALKYMFHIESTWSLNMCTSVGYIAGVFNSFYWNKKYVFRNAKEKNRRILLKTFICYGVAYLISMIIMDVLVDQFHISTTIAPILRLIITIPLNYIANKLWAYKDYNDDSGKEKK